MKPIKPVYENIKNELDSIREGINLIAVTKQVGVERTKEAVEAGIEHLGENRPEGLLKKFEAIQDGAKWHFIGNLQSRKVKDIINHIDYLHSLDRLSLAKEIQKRADRVIDCFVQVNVSKEESKSGILPEETLDFIKTLEQYDKINIIGLMTMAPNVEDEEVLRKVFQDLKALQLDVAEREWPHAPCTETSMGMSNDYLIAAQEGATFVRIGTALIGSESEAE
ncbi:YggS family pyridoxal phosphate-dependent enzyme [Planococcus halotolerans]|uniref:Pyridoxal phosphate homeostasis protein n=1 Tax=Planococcus halotolerans TaxID=2233542 RepID=A0A365L1U8_9BACL|nr:YggS family pyridoxal phosphate-dependent enzyme [Planococcus halotolerans]QHJ70891.1 YggS family pyridoxal phosphate-dependent enzyme [Planococcus halotolerans]RAZ79354.1 YggS family pyridoxal phosphate-dependent enzyme [Planococcus halotolerans]